MDKPRKTKNAWLICLGDAAYKRCFSVTAGNDSLAAVSFGRIYHFDSDNAGGKE